MCVDTSLCIVMLLFLSMVTASSLMTSFLDTALEERKICFLDETLNSDNSTQTCFFLAVSLFFQNYYHPSIGAPIKASSYDQKKKRKTSTPLKKMLVFICCD